VNLSTELASQYAFLQQGPEASMLWLTAYQWAALFCLLENDGVTFFLANDFDKAIRHPLCVVLGGICCEFMQEHCEIRGPSCRLGSCNLICERDRVEFRYRDMELR